MHSRILHDYGDIIYRAIEKSRTPLTDELLKILIILVASIAGLSLLDFILRRIVRRSGHEEDAYTVDFIFTMIRYLVLLTAIYLAIRACITEITYTKVDNLRDLILWLHGETTTLFDYSIKILVALVIFIVFNAGQNALFRVIRKHLDRRDVSERFSRLLLTLIRIVILSFLVVSSAMQLMITGGESLLALAIYIYICFIIALPPKSFRSTFSSKESTMSILVPMISWTLGMVLLVAISIGVFNGLNYLLTSGGKEISYCLTYPEDSLAKELNTYFLPDDDLSGALSGEAKTKITVETDGELNLLYLNDRQIGVNTSGRKYQFFGVSINMPEITAVHRMTFPYEIVKQDAADTQTGTSQTLYYCRPSNNDCLVLTVNRHSNRVVNMTYYTDYQILSSHLVTAN